MSGDMPVHRLRSRGVTSKAEYIAKYYKVYGEQTSTRSQRFGVDVAMDLQ